MTTQRRGASHLPHGLLIPSAPLQAGRGSQWAPDAWETEGRVVMACFDRQGRVSSDAGAERRGRQTWEPWDLPTAARLRLDKTASLPILAGGTGSLVGQKKPQEFI